MTTDDGWIVEFFQSFIKFLSFSALLKQKRKLLLVDKILEMLNDSDLGISDDDDDGDDEDDQPDEYEQVTQSSGSENEKQSDDEDYAPELQPSTSSAKNV